MSTVIILCPAMPHQSNIDDWIEGEVLTQFSWNLQGPKNLSGVGRIADIPFVDEAIVYLDTADVRLVSTIVPPIRGKQLQQVIVNLLEDQLLSSMQHKTLIELTPNDVAEKTFAVINQSWLQYLLQELQKLSTRRIVLLPDCFILPFSIDIKQDAYTLEADQIKLLTRTSLLMGAAWREKYSSEPGGAVLPSVADFQGARAMDWPFILKNYRQFLNENPQISLIPSNFRFQRESSQAEAAHHAWQSFATWLGVYRWLLICLVGAVALHAGFLGAVVYKTWQWDQQMLKLAQAKISSRLIVDTNSLPEYIDIARGQVRQSGQLSQADFLPMLEQLSKLLQRLGGVVPTRVVFNERGILFELSSAMTAQDVFKKSGEMHLQIIVLGNNQYLLPIFAGLREAK